MSDYENKSNVIPVSFKKTNAEQILKNWAYEQGALVGVSSYIKLLIQQDMEKKLKLEKHLY